MPRRRELSWGDLRLGIVVTVLVVAAVLAVALAGTTRGPFTPDVYPLYLDLDDAAGIRVGSLVQVAGLPAGEVTNVEIAPPEPSAAPAPVAGDSLLPAPQTIDIRDIRVELSIQERFRPYVTPESRAQLASLGMGGERYIKITAGDVREEPLPPGATVPEVASVDLDLILAKLARAINEAQVIAGMGAEIQARVAAGGGTAGRLLVPEGPLYGSIRTLQAESEAMMALLEEGEGLVPRWRSDPTLARQIDSLEADLAALDALADAGALALWTEPTRLRAEIDTLKAGVTDLSTRLEDGRGSLGRFLNDDELFLQIRVLQTEVAALAAAFRADPLGFVNIEIF